MRLNGLRVKINQEQVFRFMNCSKQDACYDMVFNEYRELESEICRMAEPAGLFSFGTLTDQTAVCSYPAGTKVIYLIVTLGSAVSDYCTRLFDQGEYLKGMLADAMADSCLFSLEACWQSQLWFACSQAGVGIERCLEAPTDLPIKVQEEAFVLLHAGEELGMKLTSAFMFDPVKSICQIFLLTADETVFCALHSCQTCERKDCNMKATGSPS